MTVAGSNRGVSGVAVSGTRVTLTLSSAAVFGQTVTVGYTKPGTAPLRDLAPTPNDVESFTGQSVSVRPPPPPPPPASAWCGLRRRRSSGRRWPMPVRTWRSSRGRR